MGMVARGAGCAATRQKVNVSDLADFVDRIEVLFVISQLLREKGADLPGKQYLEPWARLKRIEFGGPEWKHLRKVRRYSTALSAPIAYGPSLKMLGWLVPHPDFRGVMLPTDLVQPALDALEARMGKVHHDAFTKFGRVVVKQEQVQEWSVLWALDKPSAAEANVMADLLFGGRASKKRREAGQLLLRAIKFAGESEESVREAMAGPPSRLTTPAELLPVQERWRTLQIRQLFRFSLEALLFWIMNHVSETAASTSALVTAFADDLRKSPKGKNAKQWLNSLARSDVGPVELIAELRSALRDDNRGVLAEWIATGIAYSLRHAPAEARNEATDRLPLARAKREAEAWPHLSVNEFLRQVFESWVLAQHEYWSVGRGLADARAGVRTLLRLKVTLGEGGWTLARGGLVGNPPIPTPDRLATAISLARQCRLLI